MSDLKGIGGSFLKRLGVHGDFGTEFAPMLPSSSVDDLMTSSGVVYKRSPYPEVGGEMISTMGPGPSPHTESGFVIKTHITES